MSAEDYGDKRQTTSDAGIEELIDQYMDALASGDDDRLRDCENKIEDARQKTLQGPSL